MIDGHCHLTAKEFNEDRTVLIDDAKQAGVEGIVVVCQSLSDFGDVISLCEGYPNFLYPCLGLHPIQFGNRSVTLEDFEQCKDSILNHCDQLVGIGEIGLDFTPRYITCPEDKDIQREVFRKQITFSKRI